MLIYVDVDNTIAQTAGMDYKDAQPYPERIKTINELYMQGHTIVYWTARGTKTGINHKPLTMSQLLKWGCKFHDLKMGKPAFDLFIDDKAMRSLDFFNDSIE